MSTRDFQENCECKQWIGAVRSDIGHLKVRVDRLATTVVEDNRDSLVSQVAVMKNAIEDIKETLDQFQEYSNQLRLVFYGSLLSVGSSIALFIVQLVMKR